MQIKLGSLSFKFAIMQINLWHYLPVSIMQMKLGFLAQRWNHALVCKWAAPWINPGMMQMSRMIRFAPSYIQRDASE